MAVTDELRQDHRLLRQKLETLEAGVETAPKTAASLHRMCYWLTKFLDAHIWREKRALAPYADRIRATLRERMLGEHADEWLLLHELDAIFSSKVKLPTSVVVERLSRFIDELRDHMDVEELEVFTVVDRAEQDQRAAHAGR